MRLLTLALLAALPLVPLPARAAQAPTVIVVSGVGSVTLPPTLATVSASVQTAAPNASEAVAHNNAIYGRVVAALTALGIARSDITLGGYNVNYNPTPATPRPGEVYGYTVNRDFNVKVHKIGDAGAVVDACTRAGATSIGGVSFGLADRSAARAQATTLAVADARAKADELARAAHLHVIAVRRIALGGGGGPVYPMMRMNAAVATSTTFDAGNVTESVTVEMTFAAAP